MLYSASMQRLTDQQILETVARAGYRNPETIAARAIAGEPSARFAVLNHFVRLNPDHAISVTQRTDTSGVETAGVIHHRGGLSHIDIPLMRRLCKDCQS